MGLGWCANDYQVYHEVLESFLEVANTKRSVIENSLKENDLKRFTIEIHAVKSSCKTIGANSTSMKAAYLEQLGNQYKQAEIMNRLQDFWQEYEKLLEVVRCELQSI